MAWIRIARENFLLNFKLTDLFKDDIEESTCIGVTIEWWWAKENIEDDGDM